MNRRPASALRWVMLAGLVGFGTSATFSSWLRWERSAFVLVYAGATLLFAAFYVASTGVTPLVQLRRRWPAGLAVGLIAGLVLAHGVREQVPSAPPQGGALVGSLVWLGLVYGSVDALLLTVIPVLAVHGAWRPEVPVRGWARHLRAGVSFLASLAVTAAYHAGFTEFRGPSLLQPLIGNGIVTMAYLLAGNPLAAILSHVIMHVAALLHGISTTVQLPPHY